MTTSGVPPAIRREVKPRETRRQQLARVIVRLASNCYDRAYVAYCEERPKDERRWCDVAIIIQQRLFPLALRLGRDAALDETANQGWWG